MPATTLVRPASLSIHDARLDLLVRAAQRCDDLAKTHRNAGRRPWAAQAELNASSLWGHATAVRAGEPVNIGILRFARAVVGH